MHQSIDRPVGVNVYGSHIVRTEPDRADVDLVVTRLAQTPGAAFDQTRRAGEAVRATLRSGGIEDEDLEISRVQLSSAHDGFGPARRFLGYESQLGFRFIVRDLEQVEGLLSAAVGAGANEVQRVRYQTSRLRELRAEARRRAVEAARRKAEIYCEAAGARIGGVIHIEDVNPETGLHRAGGVQDEAALSPEDESEVSPGGLQPGSLVITAAVMITFSLLHD